MRLLLTNDDGIDAPGINALAEAMGDSHEVWTIAPHKEMSGRSHSITLKEALRFEKQQEKRFAVQGTPADCVNLGLMAIMPDKPDLVVSGVNMGPNLGTDIIYSGTCAAAREASLRGIPGIAISLAALTGPWELRPAAAFLADNLLSLMGLVKTDCFVNINWPPLANPNARVRITQPGRQRYKNRMASFSSPRGGKYWFMETLSAESSDEEGSDVRTIREGDVSVSLIALEPVTPPPHSIHDTIQWRM